MKVREGLMSPPGMYLDILKILGRGIDVSILHSSDQLFQFSSESNLFVIYFVVLWTKIQIYHTHLLRRPMSSGVFWYEGPALFLRGNQNEYRENNFLWGIRVS